MDLLRFATAGLGRRRQEHAHRPAALDSKQIFEDQLEAVERTSRARGDEYTDLALLTDGLRAEREQGITIDVAYRYFATPKRKFIIADTPGHVQYTRNMVTGASTANLALILVDARKGILEQSRRHAFIASLLRIPHLVLCVNKMDLVDYDRDRSSGSRTSSSTWASRLEVTDLTFIPISALHGDNVVDRSVNMPWYDGPSLSTTSRTSTSPPTATSSTAASRAVRDPPEEQRAPRLPRLRGARRGRRVPAGRRGHRAALGVHVDDRVDRHRRTAPLDEAYPPMSVTMTLDDDLDISRGDMICRPHNHADGRPGARRACSAG